MLLAICLIIVAGLSSFFVLPRMEDPQLIKRGAFVHTIFPGAEPERVESLVSEKIEDALNEIEEIKEIRSASRESISSVAIELRDDDGRFCAADFSWRRILAAPRRGDCRWRWRGDHSGVISGSVVLSIVDVQTLIQGL